MSALAKKTKKLFDILSSMGPRVVALSGGLDSLLLSVISSRFWPEETYIVHALSPAVPAQAARRVRIFQKKERWKIKAIDSGEWRDKNYLRNPQNRCYYCKSHLYSLLADRAFFKKIFGCRIEYTVLSGANLNDLGEYRPGLLAAKNSGVRHPFIEAGISKEDIRQIARAMELPFAELPASPCLASRIYTGTRITPALLRTVDALEEFLRKITKISVLRCRVKGDRLLIEVTQKDRHRIHDKILEQFRKKALDYHQNVRFKEILLDPKSYKSGRAFTGTL